YRTYTTSSPDPRGVPSFPTRRSSDLKRYPGIYASLVLEIYAQNGDMALVKRALKVKGVRNEPEGRVLSRELMLRELADLDTKMRSEEHTSELQSRENLVCRLLLEKKK